MHYWYFTELDRISSHHLKIHKVKIPDVSEKGFYRQVSSLDAFIQGKRSDATKQEILNYKAGCNWSSTKLYIGYREYDWESQLKSNVEFFKTCPDGEDYNKFPIVEHENIYDFQAYIGFDRKTRKYNKQRRMYEKDNDYNK